VLPAALRESNIKTGGASAASGVSLTTRVPVQTPLTIACMSNVTTDGADGVSCHRIGPGEALITGMGRYPSVAKPRALIGAR
jgi:hypothetical protein